MSSTFNSGCFALFGGFNKLAQFGSNFPTQSSPRFLGKLHSFLQATPWGGGPMSDISLTTPNGPQRNLDFEQTSEILDRMDIPRFGQARGFGRSNPSNMSGFAAQLAARNWVSHRAH